ncbi:MFS transporter [Pseudonocardia sp.]|uniref:MFS transporter n=1 Tax=Pseudonocardia sp. TaxID=60912 RepID=UPI003D137A5C
MAWAFFADALPIYPLYALLFLDTGLTVVEVSALFAIWSSVGFVAEIPTGALADRFSRRASLAVAGIVQAAGFAVWMALPGFPGFAAGFVLWGLGGTLVSGAFEALVYDGLADVGAEEHYATVNGWSSAAGMLGQLPAAAAATLLYTVGGYAAAGWVSVALCLGAAVLATRFPEPPRAAVDGPDGAGYLATLRAGVTQAAASPAVRAMVVAVALLTGLDALEEYFGILAKDWGVPTALVPLATVAIPLAGAAGAALGGFANRLPAVGIAALLAGGLVLLGGAGIVAHPAGLVAVTAFYGVYRAAVVVADARLQERVASGVRATVTSVASLGTEIACLGVYGIWALGGLLPVAAAWLLVAVALPWLLGARPGRGAVAVRG